MNQNRLWSIAVLLLAIAIICLCSLLIEPCTAAPTGITPTPTSQGVEEQEEYTIWIPLVMYLGE